MVLLMLSVDRRRLKWLPICDEYSWEFVALEVELRREPRT
jgi:hypothetical protein